MNTKTSAIFGIGGLLALALVGCGGGGSEPPAPVPSISLSGAVARSADYNSTSLKGKFTEVTQDVNYLAGTTPQSKTYLGVPLFDVVQDALATDNNAPDATNTGNAGRRLVEHVVLSTATDGYQVTFALGELSPNFGGNTAPNQPLIAYAQRVNGAVSAWTPPRTGRSASRRLATAVAVVTTPTRPSSRWPCRPRHRSRAPSPAGSRPRWW